MQKFTVHTGVAVPLRQGDVDTDQIIPASYLRRITRTGFADALFAAWRANPDFVLNQAPYQDGSVLLAGPNFGIGSSREHAVWALQDYGFRAVLGSNFADIFANNAGKSGLLLVRLPQAEITQLWDYTEANPGAKITVDLVTQTITAGEIQLNFVVDGYLRERFLQGLDDIALTLANEADIARYEASRPVFKPTSLPVRV